VEGHDGRRRKEGRKEGERAQVARGAASVRDQDRLRASTTAVAIFCCCCWVEKKSQ
jgi:hypothetical protein